MTDESTEDNIVDSILGNLHPDESGEEDISVEEKVLEEYRTDVDPAIVDTGWTFEAAKSVEYGKTDQSLLNHVRNGVFVLAQLNAVVRRLDGYTLNEDDLRAAIALFTIHDLHKLDAERDSEPDSRFDIPQEEVRRYVKRFNLGEFASDLTSRDFRSCAIDHHNDWTANHDQSTRRFDDMRPFIRVADAFASSETPEAATGDSVQNAIDHAYPGEEFELRRHSLDDVKGILTNLIHGAVIERLGEENYQQLMIYQDGCVYLTDASTPHRHLSEDFVEDLLQRLQIGIRESQDAYGEPTDLQSNLTTRYAKDFYGINNQDFFYAGANTVLSAVGQKAISDADPDEEPTDNMVETMSDLEQYLPFKIERSRCPVGLARFVYTVSRTFVDPILDTSDIELSSLEATCRVFDVSGPVREGLIKASEDEDLSLTAGGRWDYAYGIGQALLEKELVDPVSLVELTQSGLSELSTDWTDIVEAEHAGNLRSEMREYLSDIVSVDGQILQHTDSSLSDQFEEYHRKRRGKTCVLCNRGTTSSRKSNVKVKKSLTTLQAGYSNHVPVDAGKPDELIACTPCQIELSLRETGASRRDAGRLFIHLVPDYFYTPLSWRSYDNILSEFSGESRVELGRLAEAMLQLTGEREEKQTADFETALFAADSGRQMAETLDQGFDAEKQYGTRTLGYFKPQDNETEFQFFGVYVALSVAAYAGLRVYVSESPIPDIRGRDFQTYARIGGGFSQVHDFYGMEVPLSDLKSRLRAASALIQLGYGTERNDALFAKFLRVTRNQLLPGSHLLKRIAQADDSSDARYLLEEAQVLDQETGIDSAIKHDSTTKQ